MTFSTLIYIVIVSILVAFFMNKIFLYNKTSYLLIGSIFLMFVLIIFFMFNLLEFLKINLFIIYADGTITEIATFLFIIVLADINFDNFFLKSNILINFISFIKSKKKTLNFFSLISFYETSELYELYGLYYKLNFNNIELISTCFLLIIIILIKVIYNIKVPFIERKTKNFRTDLNTQIIGGFPGGSVPPKFRRKKEEQKETDRKFNVLDVVVVLLVIGLCGVIAYQLIASYYGWNHKPMHLWNPTPAEVVDAQFNLTPEKNFKLHELALCKNLYPQTFKNLYHPQTFNVEKFFYTEKEFIDWAKISSQMLDSSLFQTQRGHTIYNMFETHENRPGYTVLSDSNIGLHKQYYAIKRNHVNWVNSNKLHAAIMRMVVNLTIEDL